MPINTLFDVISVDHENLMGDLPTVQQAIESSLERSREALDKILADQILDISLLSEFAVEYCANSQAEAFLFKTVFDDAIRKIVRLAFAMGITAAIEGELR